MTDDKDALDKFLNEPIDPSNDPTRNIPRASDKNTINVEGLRAASKKDVNDDSMELEESDEKDG